MGFSNRFTAMLGIKYPIVQAGMAGGITSPELVAAVSEEGGLGTLGAAYMTPEDMRDAIQHIKWLTAKPFAVNVFAVEMKDDWSGIEAAKSALSPIAEELQVKLPESLRSPDPLGKQIEILLEEKVPIVSTAFGLLSPRDASQLSIRGALLLAMVTSVEEAKLAQNAGYDAVVAQGSDAGGHRGTFDVKRNPMGINVGTFSLIPQVVQEIDLPVIAAGGIMDGRGLTAAMALGAEGVQMGTRFLACLESTAHPEYKRMLLESTELSTGITKAFSGRPARAIRNSFVERVEAADTPPLPFPSQNTLTGGLRKAAALQNRPEYMSLWAGQCTRLLRGGESAAAIIQETIREAEQAARQLARITFDEP
ncbi:NAD(P)H-dependent flavin oxidoreductase [Paenibacillus turpanensis]|uniref:NAD(P)H-dependent flavin oxidoreductase n=1 Tax=Paenibacillus turpanensis TaxID=2689078 RepID=UPI001407D570|nr:nitronate monooxygenase family protein [Paenibacillus turpanensis]